MRVGLMLGVLLAALVWQSSTAFAQGQSARQELTTEINDLEDAIRDLRDQVHDLRSTSPTASGLDWQTLSVIGAGILGLIVHVERRLAQHERLL